MESGKNSLLSGHLKDFDWQLNLCLASDKLATINQPLANVDLDLLSTQHGNEINRASVEMNKDDLDKLVAALEEAGKALRDAKT